MKKILLLLILSSLFSCKKDDSTQVTPTKTLVGSRWSSFSSKSIVDGSNIYKMLYFKSATEVEWYSATEKSSVIGTKEILVYEYSHPKLTVKRTTSFNNNPPFTLSGNVNDTFINVFGSDYNKE